jgi:CHAD domain-containing protein
MPEALEAQAKKAEFGGDDLLAEAARRIMTKHVRKLYNHLPGAASGDDPHDVHQARVATRRLRACLEATAPAFQEDLVVNLRRRLRRLARALGEVRDRDVLLMRLQADAEQYPEEERLPLLNVIAQIVKEREKAHAALVAELGHKRTKKLLKQLDTFLLCPLETVQSQTELPLLVRHYAGSALLRRYEEVRQFETLMPGATSEQLHDLRIACKHLRYTLELFEPALPDTVQAVTKLVTEMQEHLGELHDADVALIYMGVDPHEGEEAGTSPVSSNGYGPDGATPDEPQDTLHAYIAQRRRQRAELIAGVDPLWNRLTNLTNRRKLSGAIAML